MHDFPMNILKYYSNSQIKIMPQREYRYFNVYIEITTLLRCGGVVSHLAVLLADINIQ